MRFAATGKATSRGGRTYADVEVAVLPTHIDLTAATPCEALQVMAQVDWGRAWLRSRLAWIAVATTDAGPRPAWKPGVLHGLVDRYSAVRTEVLTAGRALVTRDHETKDRVTTERTAAYPR